MESKYKLNLNKISSSDENFLKNSGVILHSRNHEHKPSLAILEDRTIAVISILLTSLELNGVDLDKHLKKVLEESGADEKKIHEGRKTIDQFLINLKSFALIFQNNNGREQ